MSEESTTPPEVSDVSIPNPGPSLVTCEARLPIDHVIALVKLIRNGEVTIPTILRSISQITCELSGFVESWTSPVTLLSVEDIEKLEAAQSYLNSYLMTATSSEANKASSWLPVLLLIIELILKYRQG